MELSIFVWTFKDIAAVVLIIIAIVVILIAYIYEWIYNKLKK